MEAFYDKIHPPVIDGEIIRGYFFFYHLLESTLDFGFIKLLCNEVSIIVLITQNTTLAFVLH